MRSMKNDRPERPENQETQGLITSHGIESGYSGTDSIVRISLGLHVNYKRGFVQIFRAFLSGNTPLLLIRSCRGVQQQPTALCPMSL